MLVDEELVEFVAFDKDVSVLVVVDVGPSGVVDAAL